MRRKAVWSALCLSLWLVGCSFNQAPAPVSQARVARHAVKAPAAMPVWYRIRPGDNLFRIALEHGLEWRQLAEWNGLDDASVIRAGELLRLKPREVAAPTRQAATTAEPEAQDAEPAEWVWPAKGEVISRFDSSGGANGLDIAGQRGSPVRAAAPGRIVYAGAGLRGYGKLIIIRHSTAVLSAYGHNERVLVSEGQTVKLGQVIADMGDSDADRVKLHFEIREYGKPVDPMSYLPG
ncbi:MAG: peptidoglycan DD-metalloendopeptidase family protein [Hydrogenophilaceae bacterium]